MLFGFAGVCSVVGKLQAIIYYNKSKDIYLLEKDELFLLFF